MVVMVTEFDGSNVSPRQYERVIAASVRGSLYGHHSVNVFVESADEMRDGCFCVREVKL